MTRERLIVDLDKLRGGIREHRNSTGHEFWWHHPVLWGSGVRYSPRPILTKGIRIF